MTSIVDLGSMVRELLNAVPTIVEGLQKTYNAIIGMKDTARARSDMKRLAEISDRLEHLMFEKGGIRDVIRDYCREPGRANWFRLQSKLNYSQDAYNAALKSMDVSVDFKARHPELMQALLTTIQWKKDTIVAGMGERLGRPRKPSEAEIQELEKLQPLFDEYNAYLEKLRKDISVQLLEFDKKRATA